MLTTSAIADASIAKPTTKKFGFLSAFSMSQLMSLAILSLCFVGGSHAVALDQQAKTSALSSKPRNARHVSHSIESSLRHLLPDESIHVAWLNRSVVLSGMVSSAEIADQALSIARQYVDPRSDILNMMHVRLGQQVMLRVRIAEVKRHALSKTSYRLSTGKQNTSELRHMLDHLSIQGLVRMVAEPNLVAISGEEAMFVAGNEMPVPGKDGEVLYKHYGTKIAFTPYVMADNRLRLHVQPEISYIDSDDGSSNHGNDPQSLPRFASHKASTTVEMAPGETFMIAGIVSEKIIQDRRCFMGSCKPHREDIELVIAVTPYLVHPITGLELRVPSQSLHAAGAVRQAAEHQLLRAAQREAIPSSETPSSKKNNKRTLHLNKKSDDIAQGDGLPKDATLEGPVGYSLP